MKLFLYFSQIIGMDALDAQGEYIGGLHDLVMNPQGDIYPKATALIIRRGMLRKEYAWVKWEDVTYIEDELRLKLPMSQISFQPLPFPCDFTLRRDILDQQVVDTDDQRVVRVNDLHLLRVENQLYAAHVDVGLRALVRRLGYTQAIDAVVRLFNHKSLYLTHEELISWKSTQILPKLGRMKSVVKLDVARNKLAAIPPAALAEIMQDLDLYARASLFKSLEASVQRNVFADMKVSFKAEIIDQLGDGEAANLIANIPADEATDLLMKLPRPKTHQLMNQLGTDTNKKLRKLLSFAKDSAGGLMTTEYLTLPPEATVADAMNKIKTNAEFHGGIFFLYMVDDAHKYLGTTSLRRFINEPPEKPVIETCYPDHIFVHTDGSVEEVALLLERNKFSSIPVLNHDGVVQGVISVDDVMEELIALVWSKYKEKL